MSYPRQFDVDFTTTSGGAATVYTDEPVTGNVLEIRYDYGDAATGATITVTGEESGKAILTITNAGTGDLSWRPRQGIHPVANATAGSLLTYDATRLIYEFIPIAAERIKIVVASGGDTKSGQLEFIIG